MIIGPSLRKECPYCGEVKELISLRSGNTFRATRWSDTMTIYPMLPKNSDVQKCPGCGKYYFLADAKTLPAEKRKNPFMNLFDELMTKEELDKLDDII